MIIAHRYQTGMRHSNAFPNVNEPPPTPRIMTIGQVMPTRLLSDVQKIEKVLCKS